MCNQGDVHAIGNWQAEGKSVADLRSICEERGHMAFSIDPTGRYFKHCAFKSFEYQLTADHCTPSPGYQNEIHIFTPAGQGGGDHGGEAPKAIKVSGAGIWWCNDNWNLAGQKNGRPYWRRNGNPGDCLMYVPAKGGWTLSGTPGAGDSDVYVASGDALLPPKYGWKPRAGGGSFGSRVPEPAPSLDYAGGGGGKKGKDGGGASVGGKIEFLGLWKDTGDRALPIKMNVNPGDPNQIRRAFDTLVGEMRAGGVTSGIFAAQSYNQMHWSANPKEQGYKKHGLIGFKSSQASRSTWSGREHRNEGMHIDGFDGKIEILGGDWQNAVYKVTLGGGGSSGGGGGGGSGLEFFLLHDADFTGRDERTTSEACYSVEAAAKLLASKPRQPSTCYAWRHASKLVSIPAVGAGEMGNGAKWVGGAKLIVCGKDTGHRSKGKFLVALENVDCCFGDGQVFPGVGSYDAALRMVKDKDNVKQTAYFWHSSSSRLIEKPKNRGANWVGYPGYGWLFLWADERIGGGGGGGGGGGVGVAVAEGHLAFSNVTNQSFDQNGVLYAIGTDFGRCAYSNPADSGKVAVKWSPDAANYYSTAGGHKMGDATQAARVICANQHLGANATMWSQGQPGAWFTLDLKSVSLRPTHFAYRNDYGGGGNHPRTFELQGSTDGASWVTLSKHQGETWSGNSAKHWPIHDAGKAFTQFRVLNQGAPNHLCCSGIELYGHVGGGGKNVVGQADPGLLERVGSWFSPQGAGDSSSSSSAALSLGSTPSHGNPASTSALNTELNNVARNTDDTAMARALVASGADLASTNGEPWRHTPLHQAAFHGRFEMAKTLVELGSPLELHSNPCGRGEHGTPIELARGGGHHAIAEMLEKAMQGKGGGKSAVPSEQVHHSGLRKVEVGRVMSWYDARARAEAEGGRLPTTAELATAGVYVDYDQWTPITPSAGDRETGRRDGSCGHDENAWANIGPRKYQIEYPAWGLDASSHPWKHLTYFYVAGSSGGGGKMAPQAPVAMGVVLGAQAVVASEAVEVAVAAKGQAPTTLIEQVAILKRELGIEGSVKDVIDQAATQLGVSADGMPLAAMAAACMKVLGHGS